MCRIGFVEVVRAVSVAGGTPAAGALRREWPAFGVIEIDERLVDHAAALTITRDLRSLDALHLAAALVLPSTDLCFAAWDLRLRVAAQAEGVQLLPASLP